MIDTVTFESNMCTGHKVKGFCDQAQNVGKVRRHGIELGLEQRFSPEITAGFVTFGLKGVWSPRNDLSFEAGVRNLGDKNYEYKEGYPMAGRVWFAGATYRF